MPPVRFKPPQEVRIRCPKGRIVPLISPDIKLGKTIVAAAPHRVTAEQLEQARRTLRRHIGRSKEMTVHVHATYPVTKKADGVKMGQGKGAIHHFVARVPAGQVLYQIPQVSPFDGLLPSLNRNYSGFKALAGKLPFPVVFRYQSNAFELNNIKRLMDIKKDIDRSTRTAAIRNRLLAAVRTPQT